mgnify:CR=1 FL=1
MTYYVHAVTKDRKWITWKCESMALAMIVQSNIIRSDLMRNIRDLEPSPHMHQQWLKDINAYDTTQFITEESNPTYYYPFIKNERKNGVRT